MKGYKTMESEEELVGKIVVSLKGGYTMATGGQIMRVDKIYELHGIKRIKLLPTDDSIIESGREHHKGWSCEWSERYDCFKILK